MSKIALWWKVRLGFVCVAIMCAVFDKQVAAIFFLGFAVTICREYGEEPIR